MPRGRRLPRLALIAAALVLSASCETTPAPVTERGIADPPSTGYHTVREGDTLYSIAWRYGVDWEDLARRNGIAAPYVIHPEQRIRVVGGGAGGGGATVARAPAPSAAAPARTPVREVPVAAAPPAADQPPRRVPAQPAAAPAGPLRWAWPLEGEIVQGFTLSGAAVNKGLDIRGAPGAAVRAAARGEVVYAGTGLRGHSRLVIVKHDDTWLSAYAHDDEILVEEGQIIAAGEQVARLDTAAGAPRVLHFEIRRQGQPVDPTGLLPRR